MRADALVRQTLEAVLPPGMPPSVREVVGARFIGKKAVTAELVMIDGLPATVSLTRWAFGWSHRFTHMEGGALSFENGAWVRVDHPQYALPLADATNDPSDLSSLRKGAEVAGLAIWNSKLLQPARGPWDGTNSATWQCCMSAAHDVLVALGKSEAGL